MFLEVVQRPRQFPSMSCRRPRHWAQAGRGTDVIGADEDRHHLPVIVHVNVGGRSHAGYYYLKRDGGLFQFRYRILRKG